MKYNKLIVFDFDGTLCHTPSDADGRRVWFDKTGYKFPYDGWWGKSESINPDIFDIPVNGWVYQKYLDAVADEGAHVILATGRLEKPIGMRANIETILNKHNLAFDVFEPFDKIEAGTPRREINRNGVYLNTGGDTFHFKANLFKDLARKLDVDEIIMYDDRHEHLTKFHEWGYEHPLKVTVVDIVNKKSKTF